jgi:C1A family cysteine protease
MDVSTKFCFKLLLEAKTISDMFDHRKLGVTNLPDVVDMAPHMAPVFNQLQLGSCSGNTFVGALEYVENKKHGFVNTDESFVGLSRLFVYYNERMIENTINEDSGAQMCDGIKALTKYGSCKEEFFPYDISKFKDKPSDAAYADGQSRVVNKFSNVEISEEAFLTVLAGGYPIPFGISIYDSFESDIVAANGLVPMPQPHEKCIGGHAVLISGYDRNTRLLKVRNSWGEDWGDKGYFYLPFDYVFATDYASDAWVIEDML